MSTYTTVADSSSSTVSKPVEHSAQQAASASKGGGDDDAGKKKKTTKRRKVNHACLYCRRSHMTCDEGRPCQRCIKREIGHLCHDERRPKPPEKQETPVAPAAPALAVTAPATIPTVGLAGSYAPVTIYPTAPITASAWPLTTATTAPQPPFLYQPETFGNEFSVLTDFLETLDDGSFFGPPTTVVPSSLMSSASFGTTASTPTTTVTATTTATTLSRTQIVAAAAALQQQIQSQVQPTQDSATTTLTDVTSTATRNTATESAAIILPAATKTEKFLLTAADQESGSRDERLTRVIRSKYEAGLLKPYNYVKGYARLSKWMDSNVSQESKQQILQPLSVLRPKFRAVAQSLRDIDLVFIEEAFERMLLDYDRVFSAMGVPACLWRRTGEIYKGNREFCELIGLDGAMMRDGRVCIYELMAEESAVNYWEKYGHVAFDSSQKAVLTSCVLRYKPVLNLDQDAKDGTAATNALEKPDEKPALTEERFINCCFSFTIRRDKWGIPSMIVGNFIAC